MNPLRRLLRRRQLEDELAQEIQTHLDEKAEALMAAGLPRREAEAAARRAFGNVTGILEQGRDVWRWPTMDSFVGDVRYAVRQMRRGPVVAAAATASLAIGIAATVTVFSWTRAVLLDPIPGAGEVSRVVMIESVAANGDWTPTSWLDYHDYRDHTRSFAGMSAEYPAAFAVGDEMHLSRLWGEMVSGNFFDLLRVRPEAGRFFSPSERDEARGAHNVVVISHDLWLRRFAGAPSAVGATLLINRFPFTIIGVAPRGFHGSLSGTDRDLWVPETMLPRLDPNGGMFLQDRKTRMFRVLARLLPSRTIAQARADLRFLTARMATLDASTNAGMSANVLPIWESHYGVADGLRAPLLLLLGACGLILMMVCANVANLLLARAANRRKELNLRLALGAPRLRLVRQLLTEAAVLTVGGSALGLLGALWLSGSLRWLVPAFAAPNLTRPQVDGAVLAFTLALTCGVTLLAGIVPALHGARANLAEALSETPRGTSGGTGSRRLRGLLVTGEMALALVALAGAGLFLKAFQRVRDVPPGFDPAGVAIGRVSLSAAGFDAGHADAFLTGVRERLERQPGVTAVSYADYVPLSLGTGSWEDLQVEGYTPGPSENMKIYRDAVAPGWFGLLRIPLLEGRDFTALDDTAHGPVMIVNREFVRRFVPFGDALGRRVHGWGHWFTIVGVVADSKIDRLTDPSRPYFYVPIRQIYRPEFPFTFFVRTTGSVDEAVALIAREARAVDPGVPVYDGISLTDYVAVPLHQQRTAAVLLGLSATIAFLLAAIGLYGVMADAVARRTPEIGIRMAMGARRAQVALMVARQAGGLLLAGVAVGLLGAAAMGRLVAAMLYTVAPADPPVLVLAAAGVIGIAVVATGVPALRAMRVDPMIALRAE